MLAYINIYKNKNGIILLYDLFIHLKFYHVQFSMPVIPIENIIFVD